SRNTSLLLPLAALLLPEHEPGHDIQADPQRSRQPPRCLKQGSPDSLLPVLQCADRDSGRPRRLRLAQTSRQAKLLQTLAHRILPSFPRCHVTPPPPPLTLHQGTLSGKASLSALSTTRRTTLSRNLGGDQSHYRRNLRLHHLAQGVLWCMLSPARKPTRKQVGPGAASTAPALGHPQHTRTTMSKRTQDRPARPERKAPSKPTRFAHVE